MSRPTLPALALLVALVAPAARADEGGDAIPNEEAAASQVPARLRALLREAPTFELFSIICERDPDPGEPALGDPDGDPYPVRRRLEVTDPAIRREVLAALYAGIAQPGPLAMCFEPHHALRATRGQEQVTLLICYACASIHVLEPGRETWSIGTGDQGEAALNRVLGQETTTAGLLSGRPAAYWLERLASPDPATREAAVDALRGALRYEDGGGRLIAFADGEEPEVAPPPAREWLTPACSDVAARRAVVGALAADATLSATSVTELVSAAIGDPDADVRAAAGRAVVALPDEPLDEALGLLISEASDGEHAAVRVRAVALLGAIGPRAAPVARELERLAAEAEAAARVGAAARDALAKLRGR